MTNERDETQIKDALSRLRNTIEVPPVDPARERTLLAAFDAHWAPRPTAVRWIWAPAATLTAIIVALNWLVVTHAPRIDPAMPGAPERNVDSAGFVAWPGSEAWPRFESGSLVRVELPESALAALGLWTPASAARVVEADVVVGQDGFARAVRLVQ